MLIRRVNARQLPEGYPVDEHFNPPYNPWDQRLCVVPDGDLFKAIGTGKRIGGHRPHRDLHRDRASCSRVGRRARGRHHRHRHRAEPAASRRHRSSASTARPVNPSETVVYRGMMLSGVPNFALAIGYTNSSWTLKVGLLCEYFCRLLRHMDDNGYDTVWAESPTPTCRPGRCSTSAPDTSSVSLADLPRQGPAAPG